MVRIASSMGILTTPYVFNVSEAEAMAKAGADVVVAHMGLTTSGTIGAKTGKTLEECVGAVQEIVDTVVGIKQDAVLLCHGGPIAEPRDAEFVLKRVKGLHGFYGASSMERLPVERAIKDVAVEFKSISLA
jgi:predicted TIM-barrel enzyme